LTHPAIQYAQDVLSGEVTACRYVKLAAQRFLSDLERTPTKSSTLLVILSNGKASSQAITSGFSLISNLSLSINLVSKNTTRMATL
jgi:hypothetical protein